MNGSIIHSSLTYHCLLPQAPISIRPTLKKNPISMQILSRKFPTFAPSCGSEVSNFFLPIQCCGALLPFKRLALLGNDTCTIFAGLISHHHFCNMCYSIVKHHIFYRSRLLVMMASPRVRGNEVMSVLSFLATDGSHTACTTQSADVLSALGVMDHVRLRSLHLPS